MGQQKIIKNERTKLRESDHALIIQNVQPSDAGDYFCQVAPSQIEMTAKLIVIPNDGSALEKPSAHIYTLDGRDISDRAMTFKQGERIEIECKGRPETPDIKWFSGGSRVVTNNNVQTDGNRLIIKSASRDHNRVYTCLIEGPDGNNVGSTTITIHVQCKYPTHHHIFVITLKTYITVSFLFDAITQMSRV